MKICWDSIEKLRYNIKKGKWYNENNAPYIYIDSCKVCNESYLTLFYNKSKFCNISCFNKDRIHPMKNKKHSEETKSKIRNSLKGKYKGRNSPNYKRKFSKEHKLKISESRMGKFYGKNHPNWKGGVTEKNIPLYNTYAYQIDFAEEVRRSPEDENILEVKCAYCEKWYKPTRKNIDDRIRALNNNNKGENKLYCSSECKELCPIYHKQQYQVGHPKLEEIKRPYQQEWSIMVKENAKYECEICGSKDSLVAHHIFPVKPHPLFQADVDNGICICENCHYEHGHKDECSTGRLASLVC